MHTPIIATTRKRAIKIAQYTIRHTNKTCRLKNSIILSTTITYKNFTIPAIKLIADTNMQDDAEVTVGISKAHANTEVPKSYEKRNYNKKP